ncbi:GumC family protein [Blastochloris viridis]|uniref:Lipopolysaccharide biosynthesis n=1 Tax=Blastochloris viridis TaxID=1079 RepID=A0A0H5BFR9_BLAVI|nr:exopolysaccharide transport family protein [Blastochloris viridis]ALK09084.1 tyrosine kinase [Blastochloris viridis]BAS01053.1 lipopolysaccharide biosynthesis [Blastochloris viridis]CUU41747.1 tyrosine kinase [Blastochloris viridis]
MSGVDDTDERDPESARVRAAGVAPSIGRQVAVEAGRLPLAFNEPAEVDLGALGRSLWEKRKWILAPTLVAAAVTFVAVNLMTPVYTSESRILVENRESAAFRLEIERTSVADRTLVDPEAVTSQVQLLLSRDLGRQVVKELKLDERPEFNSGGSLLSLLLRLVGLGDDSRAAEERVLKAYFDRLRVYPIDKSRVIAVEFESRDRDLAAKVANAVAETYLGLQQLAKQDTTRQASNWLQGEIEKLRKKVAEAEGRVEAFRTQANLFVGVNNTQLSNQQLSELNTQLGTSRAQKSDAEAKARSIRGMLASGRPIEVSEILNSELIRRLVEQRVTLTAVLAEQSSTLLGQHPRIKELRAQISALEGQIRREADRMVRAFESDARIAEAREQQLAKDLEQMKRQAAGSNEQDVHLRALEREAKAQRDLLESYLARYRDSAARDTLSALPADARIISRATPSNVPSFPKKLPIIALVTLTVLVLSAGLLVSAELFSGRTPPSSPPNRSGRTAPDAEATRTELGEASAPAPGAPTLSDLVRERGAGMVAVAPANGSVDASPIVVRLARGLAVSGRAVLIELDPRQTGASLVGDPAAPGVVDLVRGTASFGQVIQRDRTSRLHIVPTGAPSPEIEDLLAADRLVVALSALAQTYDHVILAAPPATALAKAAFAPQLPLVVVVGPKKWEPAEAEQIYDQLTEAGIADLIAVVEDDAPDEAAESDDPVMAA